VVEQAFVAQYAIELDSLWRHSIADQLRARNGDAGPCRYRIVLAHCALILSGNSIAETALMAVHWVRHAVVLIGLVMLVACIGGCAEQSAMRIANDTVRINVSTAPIYGALEPERRAMLLAAEETVKNGFDKFIIVDGRSQYNRNVIANNPGYISATPGQLTAVGPSQTAMPRFESAIIIKMFKANDPAAANAVDAREVLASQKR
jgi:hypothetical protein